MKDERIVILGMGGHGKVAHDILCQKHYPDHVFFLDNDVDKWNQCYHGSRCLGAIKENLSGWDGLFIAIGDNVVRWHLMNMVEKQGYFCQVAIDESSMSTRCIIHQGAMLAKGAILGVGSVVRRCAILNSGCIVDHECDIGRCVHIAPGAKLAGGVKVGDRAFVGLGANIIQGVTIGPDAVIGAGSVVLKDVPQGEVWAGVPARKIKENECINVETNTADIS